VEVPPKRGRRIESGHVIKYCKERKKHGQRKRKSASENRQENRVEKDPRIRKKLWVGEFKTVRGGEMRGPWHASLPRRSREEDGTEQSQINTNGDGKKKKEREATAVTTGCVILKHGSKEGARRKGR